MSLCFLFSDFGERVSVRGRGTMSQGTQGAQTLRRSASFTLALAGSGSACAAALQPSPASSQAFQQELRVYQETVCNLSPFCFRIAICTAHTYSPLSLCVAATEHAVQRDDVPQPRPITTTAATTIAPTTATTATAIAPAAATAAHRLGSGASTHVNRGHVQHSRNRRHGRFRQRTGRGHGRRGVLSHGPRRGLPLRPCGTQPAGPHPPLHSLNETEKPGGCGATLLSPHHIPKLCIVDYP